MSTNTMPWTVLGGALALTAGCGFTAVPVDNPPTAQQSPPPRKQPSSPPLKPRAKINYCLDGPTNVSLEKLLTKPRSELAHEAEELAETIQLQEKNHRENNKPYALLPDLSLPLAVPVFRQARYWAALKLSLPPYLIARKTDNEIALHLAHFGDSEAALRIADKSNKKIVEQIQGYTAKRNYPLEWTRLVGLQLHAAQIGLAAGELDSGRRLIALHKQLQKVLNPEARRSTLLGAALLPRGRTVLNQAAAAWRKAQQPELANQAEAILARWGKAPDAPLPVRVGDNQAQVAAWLGTSTRDRACRAPDNLRALDLLGLPFPDENLDAVVASVNTAGRLAEINLIYQPGLGHVFPQPEQLAHLLEERNAGKDRKDAGGLRWRSYKLGKAVCEVTMIANHSAASAVVRVGLPPVLEDLPALPRSFEALNLDNSFEQNRRRLAPNQSGPKIAVAGAALARVPKFLEALRPAEATLERDPHHDLVGRFQQCYVADRRGLPALAEIALPLWKQFGPAHLEEAGDETAPAVGLVWEDVRTRITLRLPYDKGQAPMLHIRDRTPPEEMAGRAVQVAARDRADRAERFQKAKRFLFIARERESIGLGMTRSEVLDSLPRGKGIVCRDLTDGVAVFFKKEAEESPGYIPRELFIRFGPDHKVAEVRVRYTDAAGAKRNAGIQKLLAGIRKQCGAPEALPGPWAKVWARSFPCRKLAPVLYRWQDDATLLTCQRDSEGVELALRDCPLENETGIPLGAFRYLPAGPEHCNLAMKKADLLKRWHTSQRQYQQGILILFPARNSPYQYFQVAFTRGGQVERITARHKIQLDDNATPEQLARAVQHAWAADVENLGWPRREDQTRRGQVQSWSSHDDVTRLSIFWQADKSGTPGVFTEWALLK